MTNQLIKRCFEFSYFRRMSGVQLLYLLLVEISLAPPPPTPPPTSQPPPPPPALCPWVAQLLNDLDLNQYAEVMIDQEIDLPVLAQLNEEQLFRIGISKMGHRIRIMDSAKEAMETYRLMDAVERANIELFGK